MSMDALDVQFGGPMSADDKIDGSPAGLDARYNCQTCSGFGRLGDSAGRYDCADCDGTGIRADVAQNQYIWRPRLVDANRRRDAFQQHTERINGELRSRESEISRLESGQTRSNVTYALLASTRSALSRMRQQRNRWYRQAQHHEEVMAALSERVAAMTERNDVTPLAMLDLLGLVDSFHRDASDAVYGDTTIESEDDDEG